MTNGIKRSTIEKLLKINETPEASILEKFAKEEFGDQFQELVEHNILTHFKILKSIEVFDEGSEYTAEIQRRDGKNMYSSSADGKVAVNDEDINLYKINFEWLLRSIMDALDIADRHEPKDILEDNIWALGQHRIEKQNTNIIVVRNIKNTIVFDDLINHLNKHHGVRNKALVIALGKNITNYRLLPSQNELIRIDDAIKWDKGSVPPI